MGIIRVAIADDHKIFRKGVILSLRPFSNIKFVLEAENGEELVNNLAAAEAAVVLMELPMPGNNEIALSDKERDVLRFICMEFTAAEIAQKMEISPRTVEAIKDRLMERFGSKNTAGLVFFAVKNNLIE